MIYNDIETYKRISNKEKRKKISKTIFATYLSPNAPLEVNVTGESIASVRTQIDKGVFEDDLFLPIQTIIRTNLSDVLSRFVKTKQFRIYEKNERLASEMLKKAGIQ